MKKLVLILTAFVMSLSNSFAFAGEAMKLKNFSMNSIDESTILMTYGKEKITLEKISDQRVKINGQMVVWNSQDSLESLQSKIERAYKVSKSKSARLESLFIQDANAFSLLMSALFGGFFGFALGNGVCKKSATQSTIQQQPASH